LGEVKKHQFDADFLLRKQKLKTEYSLSIRTAIPGSHHHQSAPRETPNNHQQVATAIYHLYYFPTRIKP
jgi:hypothetical protein